MKRVVAIIFGVLFIDQLVKVLVKTNMIYADHFDILWGSFQIYFVENNGMAFGLELGGEIAGKLVLSTFRIIASVLIWMWLRKLVRLNVHKGFTLAVALIFAGAVGNIIDSLFYGWMFGTSETGNVAEFLPEGGGYAGVFFGKVVDMIHFNMNWPDWMPWLGGDAIFPPIFNVADASITIGVVLILLKQKTFFASEKKAVEQEEAIKSGENLTSNIEEEHEAVSN